MRAVRVNHLKDSETLRWTEENCRVGWRLASASSIANMKILQLAKSLFTGSSKTTETLMNILKQQSWKWRLTFFKMKGLQPSTEGLWMDSVAWQLSGFSRGLLRSQKEKRSWDADTEGSSRSGLCHIHWPACRWLTGSAHSEGNERGQVEVWNII